MASEAQPIKRRPRYTERVVTRVSEQTKKRLDRIAEKQDRLLSEVGRDALNEYAQREGER